MNTKQKKDEPAFTIHGQLAEVLEGMEGTNWSTTISKHNVKSVRVYFHTKQPTVGVKIG